MKTPHRNKPNNSWKHLYNLNPIPAAVTVHFSGKAAMYALHRPDYASASVRSLIATAGLRPDSIAADIGSGTGLFSRHLLDAGLRVIGVEPNDEMREEAAVYLAGRPRFASQKGTAENTGLADACVDIVTVAQAFHWFDKDLFREECRRILRGGGPVAILWNHRETDNDLCRELVEVNRAHCPSFISLERGVNESKDVYPTFFRKGSYISSQCRNDLAWDWNTFVGRSLSSSYAPRKGDPEYVPYISDLRALFDRYSQEGILHVANVTMYYLGKV